MSTRHFMKQKIWFLMLFVGIVFFIPSEVNAETNISICSSGCDFTSFGEAFSYYYDNDITDDILNIELKSEEYYEPETIENLIGCFPTIRIKGVSSEETILSISGIQTYDGEYISSYLTIDDVTINASDSLRLTDFNDVSFNNVVLNYSGPNADNVQAINIYNANNVSINNLELNISSDTTATKDEYYDGVYINSNNVDIDTLTVNNNSSKLLNYGVILDDVTTGSVDNLTVNNSVVGLYVHRIGGNNVNSSIEVNNSNLLNNTCSSFNVIDVNDALHMPPGIIMAYTPNNGKNYQVIFNSGNSLNCAVASGHDTNTFVSGDNTWESTPTKHTYDSINYDELTGTVQNVSDGTVDIAESYRGKVTIEEGSSIDASNAFDNIDLPSDITWTVEDESIARIENGTILGIKEGTTKVTGVSSDGLTTYLIEVTVINNPVTSSMLYISIGMILILILGTTLYIVYEKKKVTDE